MDDVEEAANDRAETPPMSLAARRRVNNATGAAGLSLKRCLIENTEEVNAVQYAHCLPRATKEDTPKKIKQLEYSWNLPHKSLNLDTRYNIIRLSKKLHRLFDRNHDGWMLLPERRILEQYVIPGTTDALGRNEFPVINAREGTYRYTLVPSKIMSKVPIHRQREPLGFDEHGNPSIPSKGDYDYYRYPYEGFPVIVSHLHPRYVIGHVAMKLNSVMKRDREDIWDHGLQYTLEFALVNRIWRSWTKRVVESVGFRRFTNGNSRNDERDADDIISNSVVTRSGRIFPPSVPTRLPPDYQGSITLSGSKKMKDDTEGTEWNDDETQHDPDS